MPAPSVLALLLGPHSQYFDINHSQKYAALTKKLDIINSQNSRGLPGGHLFENGTLKLGLPTCT